LPRCCSPTPESLATETAHGFSVGVEPRRLTTPLRAARPCERDSAEPTISASAESSGEQPGEAADPGRRNGTVVEMVAIIVIVSLLAMAMLHEMAFALLAERIPALR
jgi:hypothetical protein